MTSESGTDRLLNHPNGRIHTIANPATKMSSPTLNQSVGVSTCGASSIAAVSSLLCSPTLIGRAFGCGVAGVAVSGGNNDGPLWRVMRRDNVRQVGSIASQCNYRAFSRFSTARD
jgi:hypothetical protein